MPTEIVGFIATLPASLSQFEVKKNVVQEESLLDQDPLPGLLIVISKSSSGNKNGNLYATARKTILLFFGEKNKLFVILDWATDGRDSNPVECTFHPTPHHRSRILFSPASLHNSNIHHFLRLPNIMS